MPKPVAKKIKLDDNKEDKYIVIDRVTGFKSRFNGKYWETWCEKCSLWMFSRSDDAKNPENVFHKTPKMMATHRKTKNCKERHQRSKDNLCFQRIETQYVENLQCCKFGRIVVAKYCEDPFDYVEGFPPCGKCPDGITFEKSKEYHEHSCYKYYKIKLEDI